MSRCELCQREPVALTRHHLIPRSLHRKLRTAREFSGADLHGRIAMLCRACHKFIHTVLTEKQLATSYNSLEALRTHPEIHTFVLWLSGKPPGLRVKSARRRA